MKKHIDEIVSFVAVQMDGKQPPPAGSADLKRLGEAVAAIQARPTDKMLNFLALGVLGAVIDRVSGNIAAQQALQSFIRGGDHA